MELALEDSRRRRTETMLTSFNPCYDGIGSRSARITRSTSVTIAFQSLLWWNWLTKKGIIIWSGNPNHVSILVMMELAHEVVAELVAYLGNIVSILVMMELAHEVAHVTQIMKCYSRFNPCYDGIGSRSCALQKYKLRGSMFQSLLWWNWLTKQDFVSIPLTKPAFQSLLWWNWLTKKVLHSFDWRGAKFQSLLWWNWLTKCRLAIDRHLQ